MKLQASVLGALLGMLLSPSFVQAQTYSKTEIIEYHDDLSRWVLGQTAKQTVNGVVAAETSYNSNAQPSQRKAFGKVVETLSYHADGTVAAVTDGNGNTTTLSSWKRGTPQSITYADGSTQSAVVDDIGWIRSLTDEVGSKTCYDYDVMGRIKRIDYPSETQVGVCDATDWNATIFSFEYRNMEEHGLPPGHWLHTQSTGNAHKNVFLDSLWRPVLVHEFDAANIPGTLRATRTGYDESGRADFRSYPSSQLVPPIQGIWTRYDAIGRVTSVSQDSEQGLLLTRTEYSGGAAGPWTRVTDPKGNQTRTWYQMFDQPSYEAPVRVEHPDGAITEIPRDVFGKPIEIWRR